MKIAHCIFGLQTGGAEILTLELVNRMCVNNDVVLIIVNNDWNNEILKLINPKIKLYLIQRPIGSHNPLYLLSLNILLYKLKPDIVHCHDSKMGKLIKVKGPKIIYTIHAMGIPVDFYHHYDLVVAISDAVYNDVIAKCSGSIKTIYNGINFQAFRRRISYILADDGPFKLVQVSRLNYQNKGQDILLHAVSKLRKEHKINLSVDFIGKGESLSYLKGLCQELGIQKSVNFNGEKKREWLYSNLSDYHLLVQPSRYEGFGLTILEGLAAGIPVLTSDIDGPEEIIRKTAGGLLFTSGDVQSCVDAIIRIFNMYKANKIQEFISRTVDLNQTEYSLNSCVNNYLHEYRKLIGQYAVIN
ncbi:glycosyltransferase [Pontibacter amylolyticus]|uniref:Glycosyl transferase family 1 n=1 Tax=Pontibacter amylolyticus TaxID=1424080 RepID=A0ABQ1W519_9BACT|nr:glycosyltransferase [Pontibacter amylolyticus]GGG12471.1 glycosyl transferase family 1 [Pontibacter amylolyticus]